jgi:CheY-like chemotaxis protein
VDDDANIRELLRQQLEREGYNVREGKDGVDAIHQIKTARPDLILLDVMMPQINGFDVAAVLKNDPQTADINRLTLSCETSPNISANLLHPPYFGSDSKNKV